MITRDLSFAAGEELLAAKRVTPDGPVSARMLFLHGAGKAVKERALPLAERLAVNHSIESFLFDFSVNIVEYISIAILLKEVSFNEAV